MALVNDLVMCSEDILGGTPVFRGTRVPIQALFDYLDEGQSIAEFLDDFPTVTPEQARSALSLARDAMLADARPARRMPAARMAARPPCRRGYTPRCKTRPNSRRNSSGVRRTWHSSADRLARVAAA